MKSNYYRIILFLLCFSPLLTYSQVMNSKANKTVVGRQDTLVSATAKNLLLSNISKNINGLMKKTGAVTKSGSKSMNASSTKLNASFQLPSVAAIANGLKNVKLNKENGTPRLIELNTKRLSKSASVKSTEAIKVAAQSFLQENKALLKIDNPLTEFSVKNLTKDTLGMTHIKYMQKYKGIEVWGKEVVIHTDAVGNISLLNGVYEQTPNTITDTVGSISENEALSIVAADIDKRGEYKTLSEGVKKVLNYKGPVAKKIIWFDANHKPFLVWHVEARPALAEDWNYFIDASNGSILNKYNAVCFDGAKTASATDLNGASKTFGTYQIGGTYYMMDVSQPMFNAAKSTFPDSPTGAIVTADLKNNDLSADATIYYVTSNDNNWSDASSISAHFNAISTYNYYRTVQKRNSIDDKGMTIYSIVHATSDGASMENAFWSGTVMCYGDGGKYFKPLAGSLDVAAHEMTHGVTQYTANLEYEGQSGALNESFSDVFGALVDSLNWTMGEMIIKDKVTFPSGALRDLANPHNGGVENSNAWQPAKMSEFVQLANDENNDYGGVHINSGIPNHAFYLVATSVGRYKAGQIWYRALDVYLTKNSQFVDARIATVKAAADLYGDNSNEVSSVKSAWDNVEVFEGSATPTTPTSQVTGEEWVLAINTDYAADPNSMYMAATTINSSSDFYALSQTKVGNRPAITDATGIILFIDEAHNLKALYANPNNPSEQYLSNAGYWKSVAAGPGLNSIALTSIYQDTTIYYLDFVNNVLKEFTIVSQAYDGAKIKTALYADALSFDPTGRYLLFDTYNEMKKSDGSKLSYWNINLLDVQQGDIQSVFPPQAEGISVGNPSFSKTSQNRFTFDYADEINNINYVMAADFNTSNIGTVTEALSVLGFPSYSGNDETIAYHSTEYANSAWHHVIKKMPMQSDYITGSQNPQSYIIDATYPCWFIIGTRTDVNDNNSEVPSSFSLMQNYPNPFNPSTTIQFTIPAAQNFSKGGTYVRLSVYDILGRELATLVNEEKQAGSYEVKFDGANLPSGVYFYRLQAGDFVQTKKLMLLK